VNQGEGRHVVAEKEGHGKREKKGGSVATAAWRRGKTAEGSASEKNLGASRKEEEKTCEEKTCCGTKRRKDPKVAGIREARLETYGWKGATSRWPGGLQAAATRLTALIGRRELLKTKRDPGPNLRGKGGEGPTTGGKRNPAPPFPSEGESTLCREEEV